MYSDTPIKKILILAANPKGTSPLRLDQELRDIAEGLQRSQKRDQFSLEQKLAVRSRDIQRAMLDINPHIVHFSGHGAGEEGLVFEDDTGQSKLVTGTALAGLFELFADQVECVVLNGCYSLEQATAIAQHIKCVIGMSKAIGDEAAIEFAIGFYDALGAGRSIEFAYKLGCNAIQRQGIEEHLTPVLLKKVEIIGSAARLPINEVIKKWLRRIPWSGIRTTLLMSVGVTTLVVLTRFSAILEPFEFFFFDQMMRFQSAEKQDDRLLLVQITKEDIANFGSGNINSLPDKVMSDLLTTLINNKPKAIGLDLYREVATDKKSKLYSLLKNTPNLFAVCKVANPEVDSEGNTHPPEVPEERIGFSDLLEDKDHVVRRQLLRMDVKEIENNPCSNKQKTMESFSFKLAQHYLGKEKKYKQTKNGLASGNVVLEPLGGSMTGGHQSTKWLYGYQVLLNYRSVCTSEKSRLPPCSPHKIAKAIRVQDVIEYGPKKELKQFPKDKLKQEDVKNKIILIGTKREGVDILAGTPFSFGGGEPEISGVTLQAQMVSQLVSAVEDGRHLLRVWFIGHEILWILFWSLVGGFLTQFIRAPRKLILSITVTFLSLYVFCLIFFTSIKLWIPFVPPALSLLSTSGVVVYIRLKSRKLS
ncbi:CHASE2 domain-containing protein [Brasilonema bromeliae]|uniref:CHASE2 domain-containing protein n=1 Tax=Brasilonema bromeliae SPC951 TaxID=385972 RepID=A0ABX1P6Q6_9CYAN|nr:CHASE2 domain-containing protein [Brasilonema bromeliae]NMG19969.1 hypothetical protein [Brasilonema bromeliae SPC951]